MYVVRYVVRGETRLSRTFSDARAADEWRAFLLRSPHVNDAHIITAAEGQLLLEVDVATAA